MHVPVGAHSEDSDGCKALHCGGTPDICARA